MPVEHLEMHQSFSLNGEMYQSLISHQPSIPCLFIQCDADTTLDYHNQVRCVYLSISLRFSPTHAIYSLKSECSMSRKPQAKWKRNGGEACASNETSANPPRRRRWPTGLPLACDLRHCLTPWRAARRHLHCLASAAPPIRRRLPASALHQHLSRLGCTRRVPRPQRRVKGPASIWIEPSRGTLRGRPASDMEEAEQSDQSFLASPTRCVTSPKMSLRALDNGGGADAAGRSGGEGGELEPLRQHHIDSMPPPLPVEA